jgi:effector-binding domain-containing protein
MTKPDAVVVAVDEVVRDAEPMLYISTTCSTRPSSVATEIKQCADALRGHLSLRGIVPRGPLTVLYDAWNGRLVTIEIGLPVSALDASRTGGRIVSGHTPSGRALHAVHLGSTLRLAETYGCLEDYGRAHGTRLSGLAWEAHREPSCDAEHGEAQIDVYLKVLDDPDVTVPAAAP